MTKSYSIFSDYTNFLAWLFYYCLKIFQEAKALQEKVFGSLKPISAEEYMKIYEITGIDVDGRRDLVEGFIPLMENCIKRFIAFAKAVPGFSNLQMDDQIGIIKGDATFVCYFI